MMEAKYSRLPAIAASFPKSPYLCMSQCYIAHCLQTRHMIHGNQETSWPVGRYKCSSMPKTVRLMVDLAETYSAKLLYDLQDLGPFRTKFH